MATTDYLAVPTANIPTAHLASIICAALRVINSSIGHLPAHDMRTVLPLLRHTNAITSHAIRRFGVTTPKARGVDEILSDVGRLEGDAQEVADLSAYLDALSANDNLGEEGAGAANTAAVTIVPAEQPVPAVVAVPLAPPVAAAAPAAPAPVAGAAGAPNPPPVPPPQGIGAGPNGGPPANVNVPSIPPPYESPPLGPDEDWPKKWYVITRGRRVGIFTNIQEVNRYVVGVSTAVHQGYKLWPEAQEAYEFSVRNGWVNVLA